MQNMQGKTLYITPWCLAWCLLHQLNYKTMYSTPQTSPNRVYNPLMRWFLALVLPTWWPMSAHWHLGALGICGPGAAPGQWGCPRCRRVPHGPRVLACHVALRRLWKYLRLCRWWEATMTQMVRVGRTRVTTIVAPALCHFNITRLLTLDFPAQMNS